MFMTISTSKIHFVTKFPLKTITNKAHTLRKRLMLEIESMNKTKLTNKKNNKNWNKNKRTNTNSSQKARLTRM